MYVLTGNTTTATQLMQSLFKRLEASSTANEQDVRYTPALVSILVSLYRSQGRRLQIKQELAKAASYWRHKSKAPTSLLLAAGSRLLESGEAEDAKAAAQVFEKLREQNKDDKSARAGFVASHAGDEQDTTSTEAEKLSSVADLTRNIDVDALERAGIPASSNAFAIAQINKNRKTCSSRRGCFEAETSSQVKAAKGLRPKARHLTLSDGFLRKTAVRIDHPKGKRKAKKGGDDRTQGGAVNESLNIDAKPVGGQVVGAGGGGGGGGGKKKKGKK